MLNRFFEDHPKISLVVILGAYFGLMFLGALMYAL